MSQVGAFARNPSGGVTIDTITGNSGGAVGPDGSDNINLLGSGAITVSGNPATHTLTITVAGGGFPWTDTSGAFSPAVENGYFITGTATATLPAAPAQGDTIEFNVIAAVVLTLQANAGQRVRAASNLSSVAGTCFSDGIIGDSITLVYRTADTTWHAQDFIGSYNVT